MLDDRMFILAGKAIFTVDNGAQPEAKHYTFKMSAPEPDSALAAMDCYFLSVLTGPDNTKDYSYMGIFDAHTCELRATKGTKVGPEAESWKVARWLLSRVWSGRGVPSPATLNHIDRCGRCGRPLTVPESVESGIGPECAAIMGIPWCRHAKVEAKS
jgi:hypothetical protein